MGPGILFSNIVILISGLFLTSNIKIITGFIILVILILFSACMSGSEVAFFSLGPKDMDRIKSEKNKRSQTLLMLINKPEELLSTILVANNLVNVGIVILSAFLTGKLFDFSNYPVAGFIIEVVAITFLILLFGEILPKVYATRNYYNISLFMAYPLYILEKTLSPVTLILILSSHFVKKRRFHRKPKISMEDLSDALELTSRELEEEGKILKSIVKFGNINVSAIMCPRLDVTAIDIKAGFNRIINTIIESGFSRIPVYSGSFDNVVGILYAKDVLPYSGYSDSFKWQSLLRPPCFVPETKKINDLLKEFQKKKMHMAIVIDEYGGTSGIITLEDILEEIVGEITDESDEATPLYRKIDENTYIFEGKMLLNDFYRVLNIAEDTFREVRGESETLAGLLLELTGEIPQKNHAIEYGMFTFIVESADKRRIKEIRVILKAENAENEKS
ncbi:MAG: gliding motility-associated protein GldE [Bacteroidales bacterium]